MRPGLRFWLLILALSLSLLCSPGLARAQSGGQVNLVRVDAAAFPDIQLYFSAYQADGSAPAELLTRDVTIYEAGEEVFTDQLEALDTGTQFTVAVNESPELANRYQGVSRFEAIRAHLLAWVKAQPLDGADDFSLSATTGLQAIRLTEPDQWAAALEAYQPALLAARPNLTALGQAIDLASNPAQNSMMKPAILYITALPTSTDVQAYTELTNRARQAGVRVEVWLVASAASVKAGGAALEALQNLAAGSGGALFHFTGAEALPDLDTWLAPLRTTYLAHYSSRINTSGSYSLAVEVKRPGLSATSQRQNLRLEVSPPNPIFLSPPSRVELVNTASEPGEIQLSPAFLNLQIMIEFPDGHPRSLKFSRLYVDNQLVAENTREPFDHFEWPLNGYTGESTHSLRVEVEDSLGLNRASIETPVQVLVPDLTPPWWQTMFTRERLIGYGAIMVAGLILVMAVVARTRSGLRAARQETRRRNLDPVTQPVTLTPTPRKKQSAGQNSWPSQSLAHRPTPACLIPLPVGGEPAPGKPIQLQRKEITLGSDPQQAMIVIDSPSVSPLHARLSFNGGFLLADCSSVAGTWVNYAPVSAQGAHLEHGDLIQLGRAAFRFELSHPPQIPEPRVESH